MRPAPSSFGIPDHEFLQKKAKNGLITKREIRAITLAQLGLREGIVIWDIGAGTGSVSIEAALLYRSCKAYAVERDPKQFKILEKNILTFRTRNVIPYLADAPEGLDKLPRPNSVFIGGSHGKMSQIIEYVADRLLSGGKIVANTITIDNAFRVVGRLRKHDFQVDAVLASIARSKFVVNMLMFESLNPVFIISGSRK